MEELAVRIQKGLPDLDVRAFVPLSELTSFRIGGPAAACALLRSGAELVRALSFCREEGICWHLLGNGTNVLAPDEGFHGLILRLLPDDAPRFDGYRVICGAGQGLAAVAKESVAHGLMGMEALSGIPGTVGGAVAMNAGAYGSEIGALLSEVTVLSGGRVKTVPARSEDFGYRKSPFGSPETIVLSAILNLQIDDGGAAARMAEFSRRRREKQPLAYPSAGSVFRRPAGSYAGALIEQCNLKGFAVGGAAVSDRHAGFIINTGGATCADVLALITTIQATVFERTGVRLEREVKLLSEV